MEGKEEIRLHVLAFAQIVNFDVIQSVCFFAISVPNLLVPIIKK
jgi:hypothetical protein